MRPSSPTMSRRSSAEKLRIMRHDALARAAAGLAHRLRPRRPARRARGTGGRAAARSRPRDRPARGPRPCRRAPCASTQASSSRGLAAARAPSGASPGGRSALARALGRGRAGTAPAGRRPARRGGPRANALGHREAHPRRDLLRLAEILVRGLLEPLALQRDDALVAARMSVPWSIVMARMPVPSSSPVRGSARRAPRRASASKRA